MVLIWAEYLLKQLTTIHFAAVGVQQGDVVRVGAVRIGQEYIVRVTRDAVESLLRPRVVDVGAKTVFSLCTGQVRIERVLPVSVHSLIHLYQAARPTEQSEKVTDRQTTHYTYYQEK